MGNKNLKNNKPSHPAPPLNALKNPEVNIKSKKETPQKSVYDEIAERRKRENHKIGVTPAEERGELTANSGSKPENIAEEPKQHTADDDVKVYRPEKKHIVSNSEPEEINDSQPKAVESPPEAVTDIYIDDNRHDENTDDEDNYDVPPLPKARKRLSPWVAIISALGALCVIAAGAYGAVNGYFDGIIKMF